MTDTLSQEQELERLVGKPRFVQKPPTSDLPKEWQELGLGTGPKWKPSQKPTIEPPPEPPETRLEKVVGKPNFSQPLITLEPGVSAYKVPRELTPDERKQKEIAEHPGFRAAEPPSFTDKIWLGVKDVKVAGDLTLGQLNQRFQQWREKGMMGAFPINSPLAVGRTDLEKSLGIEGPTKQDLHHAEIMKDVAEHGLSTAAVLEALGLAAGDQIQTLTSGDNLMLLGGMGILEKATMVKGLVDAGFSLQMARGMVDGAQQSVQAWKQGDPVTAIRGAAGATISGGFAYLSGRGAIHEFNEARINRQVVLRLDPVAKESYEKDWASLDQHQKADVLYKAVQKNAPITMEQAVKMGIDPQKLADTIAGNRARAIELRPSRLREPTGPFYIEKPPEAVPPEKTHRESIFHDYPTVEKAGVRGIPVAGEVLSPIERAIRRDEEAKNRARAILADERLREQDIEAQRREEEEARRPRDYRALAPNTARAEEIRGRIGELEKELDTIAESHQFIDRKDMLRSIEEKKPRGKALEDWEQMALSTVREIEQMRPYADVMTAARMLAPIGLTPEQETLRRGISLAHRIVNLEEAAAELQRTAKTSVTPEQADDLARESREAWDKAEKLKTEQDRARAARAAQERPFQQWPVGAPVGGPRGKETEVFLPDGRKLPAQYAVVSLKNLLPSHNPLRNFEPNEEYPKPAQPRDYQNNKEAQAMVQAAAGQPESGLLVNTNTTAENGPAVIREDGPVLGGNTRVMLQQLAYSRGLGGGLREALVRDASSFGISPDDVPGEEEWPAIVRVLKESPVTVEDLARVGSDLNRTMTKGYSDAEEAVSLARRLSEGTLDWFDRAMDAMGDEASIRELMAHRGEEIANKLQADGVWDPTKRIEFVTRQGELTNKGKILFEQALLGRVIDDPALLATISDELKQRLLRALAPLARVKAKGGIWDITDYLKEALRLWKRVDSVRDRELSQIGSKDDSLVDKYLRPEKYKKGARLIEFVEGTTRPEPHPATEALAKALEASQLEFKKMLQGFAADAEGKQMLIGEVEPNPRDSFNQHLGDKVGVVVKDGEWGTLQPLPPLSRAETAAEPRPAVSAPPSPTVPPDVATRLPVRPAAIEATPTPVGSEAALREALGKHPGLTPAQVESALTVFRRVAEKYLQVPFDDWLREHWAAIRIGEGTPGPNALYQEYQFGAGMKPEELLVWLKDAGKRVKVERLGDQLTLFGVAEPAYRVTRLRDGQSVVLNESQMASYREQLPALEAKSSQGTLFQVEDELAADLVGQRLESLSQAKKGATEFMEDGRAIVHLFESADVSTLMHEYFHIVRRQLKAEDLYALENFYGVSSDGWTRDQEENAARAWERYFYEGKAPTPELKTLFARFKDWLKEIYHGLAGSPLGTRLLSDEVREVFDRMLGKPSGVALSEEYWKVATKIQRETRTGRPEVEKPPGAERPPTVRTRRPAKVDDYTTRLETIFKPGNIVHDSYWDQYSKVLSFTPETEGKPWSVTEITTDKKGNPLPGEAPRTHHTYPEKKYRTLTREAKPEVEPPPPVTIESKRTDLARAHAEMEASDDVRKFADMGMQIARLEAEVEALEKREQEPPRILFQAEQMSLAAITDKLRELEARYDRASAENKPEIRKHIIRLEKDRAVAVGREFYRGAEGQKEIQGGLFGPTGQPVRIEPSPEVTRETPRAADRERTPADVATRGEQPGAAKPGHEPARRPIIEPEPAAARPVRGVGETGGGRGEPKQPRRALRDVAAIQVDAPARERVPGVYPAEEWAARLDGFRLPKNAPAPTVQLADSVRRLLIFPGQAEVAEMALSGLQQHDAFIIASTTGTGKTYLGSAVVSQMYKPGDRVLVLTTNKGLINDDAGWIKVAKDFDLDVKELPTATVIPDEPGVYATTWATARSREGIENYPWDLVVMDEVGDARRWYASQTGAMAKTMGENAKKVLYMSATPFHTALEVGHMSKLGLWNQGGFEQWGRQFGIYTDENGNLAGGNAPRKLAKLREQLIERGQMINQDRDMDGYKANFAIVRNTPATQAGVRNIVQAFRLAEEYFRSRRRLGMLRATKGNAVNYLKAYLERQRLPEAIELGRKLEAQGYKVIFFSQSKAEVTDLFEFLRPADEEMGGQISQLLPKLPSVVDTLQEAFPGQIANFSGPHSAARAAEKDAFVKGEKHHLYTTYAAGGQGVSLHDKAGDKPRAVIYLGPPWSGVALDQAIGRPWRYGTRSNVHALFMLSDAKPEVRLVLEKVAPRLSSLRAIVSGIEKGDPIVKSMENIEAALSYELGNKHDADVGEFMEKTNVPGIVSYKEVLIEHADTAMHKGMKYPGGVDPTHPRIERLYQEEEDLREPPPEDVQTADEFSASRDNMSNRDAVEAGVVPPTVPGASDTQEAVGRMSPADRRGYAQAVSEGAEMNARGAEHPQAEVQSTWRRAMEAVKNSDFGDYMESGGTALKGAIRYWMMHGREHLRRMGPAGMEIADGMIPEYHIQWGNHGGELSMKFIDVLRKYGYKMKPTPEFAHAVDVLEGQAPPLSEQESAFVGELRQSLAGARRGLEDHNVELEINDEFGRRYLHYGEIKEDPNYWPHHYDRKVVQQGRRREKILRSLMERGMTRGQAEDKLLTLGRDYPLAGSVERPREFEGEDYRKDPGVLLNYAAQYGEAIARTEVFGQRLGKFIKKWSEIEHPRERQRAKDIMDQLLAPKHLHRDARALVKFATDTVVLLKMPFSALPAMSQTFKSGLYANNRSLVRALGHVIANYDGAWHAALESGAILDAARQAMMREMGADRLAGKALNLYGFNLAHYWGRIVANETAKVFIEKYALPKLMERPQDAYWRRILREKFALSDPMIDEAIGNGRWSEAAYNRAGKANSDRTQFSYEQTEIPPTWSINSKNSPKTQFGEAFMHTMVLLQRTAFRNGVLLKDALIGEAKKGNFRPWLVFLAAVSVGDEVLADLYGLAHGDASRIKELGDPNYYGVGSLALRELENLSFHGGLGMVKMILEPLRYHIHPLEALAGPFWSQVGNTLKLLMLDWPAAKDTRYSGAWHKRWLQSWRFMRKSFPPLKMVERAVGVPGESEREARDRRRREQKYRSSPKPIDIEPIPVTQ